MSERMVESAARALANDMYGEEIANRIFAAGQTEEHLLGLARMCRKRVPAVLAAADAADPCVRVPEEQLGRWLNLLRNPGHEETVIASMSAMLSARPQVGEDGR